MVEAAGQLADSRFKSRSVRMPVAEKKITHRLVSGFWEYTNAVMTTSYVGSIPTLPKGKKLSGIAMFITTFVVHF
jgi:hypothetical protein